MHSEYPATDKVQEIIALDSAKTLLSKVDAELSAGIELYCARLQDPSVRSKQRKSMKDPIWGMIEVSGDELVVIDSPPIQRMRRIRQLGTTHVTYPTAGYCRFEHLLGTAYQSERMLRAVSRTSEISNLDQEIRVARLAALLHDIGHLPMSHVAERYIEARTHEEMKAVGDLVEAIVQRCNQQPKLSELFSFLIIQSKSFKTLLTNHARYSEEDISSVSLAVIGVATHGREYLVQLISNVIDADKLDYMFRDAMYTGVPLPVDLDRLLYKLRKLDQQAVLPGRGDRPERKIGGFLGVGIGGSHLIDDLLLSRRILYRQIYRHHKTLAAERLAIEIMKKLNYGFAELLAKDDGIFLPDFNGHDHTSRLLANSLASRNLPRRAIAQSYSLLPLSSGSAALKPSVSEASKESWESLRTYLSDPDNGPKLEKDLLDTAATIIKNLPERISKGAIERFWVDTLYPNQNMPDVDIFVQYPDGDIDSFDSFAGKAAAFAHSPEEFSYIFYSGSHERSPEAYLAVEITLHNLFGLKFRRQAADLAKVRFAEIEQVKRQLESHCPTFFDHARGIRPRTQKGRDPAILEELANKFRGFSCVADSPEPIDIAEITSTVESAAWAENIANKDSLAKKIRDLVNDEMCPPSPKAVTKESVGRFLDQFPEALVPAAIKMLRATTIIGQEQLGEAFATYLNKDAEPDEVFVPLTGLKKSGSLVAYHIGKSRIKLNIQSLESVLGEGGAEPKKITLFDDGIFSGTQMISIVQSLFGQEPKNKEDAVSPLKPSHSEKLLASRVRVRFAFGNSMRRAEFLTDLRECLRKAGLDSTRHWQVETRDERPNSAFQDALNNDQAGKALRMFLQEVGEQLLVSAKRPKEPAKWTDERVRNYSLGYGNAEELLIFQFNTPTATIVPLWLGGKYKGANWAPLFARV